MPGIQAPSVNSWKALKSSNTANASMKTAVTLKKRDKSTARPNLTHAQATVPASTMPITPPVVMSRSSELPASAASMAAVSMPSRPTMKQVKPNTAHQALEPSSKEALPKPPEISAPMCLPILRMCTTHQTTAAAASSARMPSHKGDTEPIRANNTPSKADPATYTPKPLRTAPMSASRPVLRRYSVATATMRKATRTSRKVMSTVWNMDRTLDRVSGGAGTSV